MSRWSPYLLVGVGGFLGANARYLAARAVDAAVVVRFPVATLLVNVSGSLLLGLLVSLARRHSGVQAEAAYLALGTGFLGAFTTFSTFELETHALAAQAEPAKAAAYVLASVLLGLLGVRLGLALGR